MQTLPLFVYGIFGLAVAAAIAFFYNAANHSRSFLLLISVWIIFQSALGINGFYKIVDTTPPRFLLLVVPPTVFALMALLLPYGRHFIDNLNLKTLTILHTIRIPVEITLYWLFLNKAVPRAITFEGSNFDVFSGITAPFIWYFGFVKGRLNKTFIIIWNLVCLGLLLNVVAITMQYIGTKIPLSASGQPQMAFFYFPFLLLPACLVPLVMFSHAAAIKQLLKKPAVSIITQ